MANIDYQRIYENKTRRNPNCGTESYEYISQVELITIFAFLSLTHSLQMPEKGSMFLMSMAINIWIIGWVIEHDLVILQNQLSNIYLAN